MIGCPRSLAFGGRGSHKRLSGLSACQSLWFLQRLAPSGMLFFNMEPELIRKPSQVFG